MPENLQIGLQLLVIGMISVFLILSIVVGLGKLIISYTNSLKPTIPLTPEKPSRSLRSISNKQIAVLSAVVDIVTDQQGRIKSIDKLTS